MSTMMTRMLPLVLGSCRGRPARLVVDGIGRECIVDRVDSRDLGGLSLAASIVGRSCSELALKGMRERPVELWEALSGQEPALLTGELQDL